MKIYTKKGDLGRTSLLNGGQETTLKDDLRIEAYGTIDELNSWVGLIADQWTQSTQIDVAKILLDIQKNLFVIGSRLALDANKPIHYPIPELPNNSILQLESNIDAMDTELQPLTTFILPRGHKEVSTIHIVRSVCRRSERRCVSVLNSDKGVAEIVTYINRLSDYFFILARYKTHALGIGEIKWQT